MVTQTKTEKLNAQTEINRCKANRLITCLFSYFVVIGGGGVRLVLLCLAFVLATDVCRFTHSNFHGIRVDDPPITIKRTKKTKIK